MVDNKYNIREIAGYKITPSPEFINDRVGISSVVGDILEKMFFEAHNPSKKTIKKLKSYIIQYPVIPQFKNFLHAAYSAKGNTKKATEVMLLMNNAHPDYLFGKLTLAADCIFKEDFDKVLEILGDNLDLKELYPDRDIFHETEIMSFNKLAILYLLTTAEIEQAEEKFEQMKEINEDHPAIVDVEEMIVYGRRAFGRDVSIEGREDEEVAISVNQHKHDVSVQTTDLPVFTHEEIWQLYNNDMHIDHQIIRDILALPRETLISDLEMVLEDAVRRYKYFKDSCDWEEGRYCFPIHAVLLLEELRSIGSLEKIFRLFRQGGDFLDFWFIDYITEEIWTASYFLGNEQLEKLKNFVLEPKLDTFSRYTVCEAVAQIAWHQPERKGEVVGWIEEVLEYLLENQETEDLIDSLFIAFIISDIVELQAGELLPLVEELFDEGLVSLGTCGNFKAVKSRIITPWIGSIYKKELSTIFDRYTRFTNARYGYPKDKNSAGTYKGTNFNDILEYQPAMAGLKTGRNDPCPCGSGKKYKKCCLLRC